jgi:glycosyltransferase involved in cell wall biosynthesis
MKRVAIVSSTFPETRPGGVPTYVEGRAARLARHFDVTVFALGHNQTPKWRGRVRQSVLGRAEAFRGLFLLVWLRLAFRLLIYRPSLIEIHNIPVGLPLFLICRVVYFFHGPAGMEARLEGRPWPVVMLRGAMELLAVSLSRRVFVVSKSFRQLLLSTYPWVAKSKKPLVRYPRLLRLELPVPIEPTALTESTPLTFVCVRRLVKRTGVKELVSAFSHALETGAVPGDTELHIVGQGPELKAVCAEIEARSVTRNVHLRGRLSSEERSKLYRLADWNIVPTQGLEGFGLVVVEAAFEGCPSLVTDVGALPEVIEKLSGIGRVCGRSVQGISDGLSNLRKISTQDRRHLSCIARIMFGVYEKRTDT